MSPEGYLVLARALAKMAKEMRPHVQPGEYEVDEYVTLHALGSMKVGDEYMQRIANKARPWRILIAAFNKLNGVTIESLVREAEEITAADEKEFKKAAESAAARLKEITWTKCNGKVTMQAPLAKEMVQKYEEAR